MSGARSVVGRFAAAAMWIGISLCGSSSNAYCDPAGSDVRDSDEQVARIDLPTSLRLAGAQNLDVQIAREKLTEARALHRSSLLQFFPWMNVGVAYDRHEGRIQDVEGDILNVDKQSYTAGAAVAGQWDLGEAVYRALASRQVEAAAGHALESRRQDTVLEAARNYFDLALAQALVGVAHDSVRISDAYESQLASAVSAGIAFQGDLHRVSVQTERNRLAQERAMEVQWSAATRLAQTLHLDATVQLVAREEDLTPLLMVRTDAPAGEFVREALLTRPEMKRSEALVEAAREETNGAVYGPLIPSIRAQVFGGGLGGGRDDGTGSFGDREDYAIGFGWRIGPGGIFDFPRQRAARSRLETARLEGEKVRDEIARQVVDALARVRSRARQVEGARLALSAARKTLELTGQRREFGVGMVLENIQAEQDLTRARTEYFGAVAEHNKAQYELARAGGASLAAR